MSELHPDWPVVVIDVRNAHNEIDRPAIIKSYESVQSLRHLALHMATYLGSPHRLETSGEAWGEAPDGHCQGDPEAGADFAVPVQPAVEALHAELAAGGLGLFGNDNGFAIGPREVVFGRVFEAVA